jgi:pyruvate formate lyase activating enzyme
LGYCTEVCYTRALTRIGEKRDIKNVFMEVEKDSLLYEKTGGGLTLSGGEPLSQAHFSYGLLKKARSRGIHTTLDTSGYVDWEIFRKIIPKVDLVLYDVKHMDTKAHLAWTGVSNGLILSNLKKIARTKDPVIVLRVPVIPGFNDSEENFVEMGNFLNHIGGVDSVELLPYHNFGEPKYAALGREYPLEGLETPEDEALRFLASILKEGGFHVIIEGRD